MKFKISIPDGMSFDNLDLKQEANGDITFNTEPLEAIFKFNGLNGSDFISFEENISPLLVNWYLVHRKNNGKINHFAENLITEVILEESSGQSFSLNEGHA